jgi:hypothetical protein
MLQISDNNEAGRNACLRPHHVGYLSRRPVQLLDNKTLTGALSAITAAVVGAIANLAGKFAHHAAFREVIVWNGFGLTMDVPILTSLSLQSLVLAITAAVAIFRFKVANASGARHLRRGPCGSEVMMR